MGATTPNVCGGCGDLDGAPGDRCGPCGLDRLACDDGELVCSGSTTGNACGGCDELDGAPGDACGVCGDGELACRDSREELVCRGASALNACGGCGGLPGAPGDACGTCGLDELACAGDGSLPCDGDTTANACGGCDPDVDARLGEACSACGTWECDPANPDVPVCTSEGGNECGGCGPLTGSPGDACGRCGLDELVCRGEDALVCDGNTAGNVCGGCSTLAAAPGTFCRNESCLTAFGTVVCNGAEGVVCDCDGVLCGNGRREGGEQCDDGNARPGDGCSATCNIEYADDPDDLPGTCSDPIELPLNSVSVWDLCDRGDDEDNVAGPNDCIDASSRGEDLVFAITLTDRRAITVDVLDADGSAAIDVVAYLRSSCATAASQIICDDAVPCGESDIRIGCSGAIQERQARFSALLDPGTYYLVVDQYTRSSSGTDWECGDVRLSVSAP